MIRTHPEHPGNHYRFCPRCGHSARFDDQRFNLMCPSCGFVLFMNSAAAVAGLIYDGAGRLLLTRRGIEPHIGKLDLPGGFVDPGENAETAMIREIKEELNLDVVALRFLKTSPNRYPFSGTVVFTLDVFFECSVSDFSALQARDDVAGFEFWQPSDVNPNDLAFQSVKHFFNEWFHEQKH
ncbi:MAG TPA: NUDIX domain-containing protein [Prolixibacteraceae bacterium]|nr:NUDIX domain-containing protein [Prolixibacteraceae bacterium]